MATVEDVARHLAGVTASEEDVLLIGDWINQRWKEVANSNTLRTLRRTGELTMKPPETTGTVSVTLASKVVTGVGTAWDASLVGQHLRAKTNWYEIAEINSATQLTLMSEYAEATATGAGYHIVQRRHRLTSNIRKLAVFIHMRLRRPLETVSREGMDLATPSRFSVNSVPTFVMEVEPALDGTKQVEIYPFSNRQELIHYLFWLEPPDLKFKDQIPAFIDIEAFREGVMIDVMRNKMFKALDDGKERQAEILRNEYRAQETRWLSVHKHRILGQDDALDDLEFILSNKPAHPRTAFDRVIDDAFDQVFFTGRL